MKPPSQLGGFFMSEETVSYKSILKLALPVSLGQLGHVLTNVADNVMLGKYDPQHLAGATFGFSVFIPLMLFCMGLTMGLTPIVSELWSQKKTAAIRGYFYSSGILYYTVLTLFIISLYQASSYFHLFDQTPSVTALGTSYFRIVLFSLIPVIVFQHFRQFIEGFGDTQSSMYVSIGGNLLNVLLNYIFIFGNFGAPEMGIQGAAYATLISRIVMCIALVIYVLLRKKYALILLNRKLGLHWLKIKKNFEVSFPIAIQLLMEVGAFAFMAIIVGWIGEDELAAHQIAISLASVSYIIVSGIGTAGTILISRYKGLKDNEAISKVIKSSLVIAIVFMGACGLSYVVGRNWLASLLLDKQSIITQVSRLLILAGLFQLSDGIQATLIGLLRGFKDVLIPTLIAIVVYWVITLPLGYYLGIHTSMGVEGCWTAFVVGLTLSSIFLSFRIIKVRKRYATN